MLLQPQRAPQLAAVQYLERAEVCFCLSLSLFLSLCVCHWMDVCRYEVCVEMYTNVSNSTF